MARPPRLNVDYFPFLCKEGKTMHYIETKYGNDGYATWVKILRLLAVTNNHYLNLSKKAELMFMASKCKITEEVLLNIISDLVDLEKFDKLLWNENKIIWCGDFTESIQDAYKKRNNKCITYDGLISLLISLGVRKPIKCKSKEPENTQRREEYSIEEKRREKKRILNKTLLSEIKISDLEEEEVEYFKIAKAFQDLFIKNLTKENAPTTHQKNANFKSYVTPIRLMMEKEDVTTEHLTKVFQFLDSDRCVNASFSWKTNILSTAKLREKFEQLILKAQSENGKQQNNINQGGASEAFRAKIFKTLTNIQPD